MLLPIAVYLLMSVISVFLSNGKTAALIGEYARWDGLITIFISAVLFAAPIIALDFKKIEMSLKGLLVSSLLVSCLAIYERVFINPFIILTKTYDPAGHGAMNSMDMSRSVAMFGSPLYLAAFLILVIPISIYFVTKEKQSDRVLGASSLSLAGFALLLSYSRGAWLGFIMSLFLLMIFGKPNLKSAAKRFFMPAAIFFAAASLFLMMDSQQISLPARILSIVRAESGARPGIWDSTLKMIESRPLFGFGPDSYKNNFIRFKQKNWNTNNRQPIPDKAHNEPLQQVATVGLIGFSAFLWALAFVFLKLLSLKGAKRFAAISISASLLAYLIQSFFNFFQVSTSPIFWLLAGMGIAIASPVKPGMQLKNQVLYSKIAIAILISTPIVILANFLWIADINFQKSLNAGSSDNLSEIAYLNDSVYLFRYEERYYLNLGKALTDQYKAEKTEYLFANVEKAFDKALKLNPDSVEALLGKGTLYSVAWLTSYDIDKKNTPALKIFTDKALKAYEAVIKVDPESTEAYLGHGTIKAYENKFKEAIVSWEKALKVAPGSANAYFNIGWANERLGQTGKALDAYNKAIEYEPEMAEAKEAKRRLTPKNN